MVDYLQYGLTETTIEFIKTKSLEGNLVFVQGTLLGADGTVVSYTPASGKNFVLIFANYQHNGAGDVVTVALKNDTNIRESHEILVPAGGNYSAFTKFEVYGDALTGNGSKKYEINATGVAASTALKGNLCGYLEDT